MATTTEQDFGQRLTARRQYLKMDVDTLSRRTGIEPERIENWELGSFIADEISLATLDKLATALETHIAELTPCASTDLCDGVQIKEADTGDVYVGVRNGQEYYRYRELVRSRDCPNMVSLIVDVLGTDPVRAQFNAGHDGHEFIYVVDGDVQASWGDPAAPSTARLQQGSSLYISPNVPHTFTAASSSGARLLAVNF